ncbi:MAG: tetratricopeptide repeat protein [Flavobacteriales bacterium]|jgi:tetratricopeptide (TPR) repeat protein|nr:tetratricopeptide repeat protein [Flavobacteriales bacterium]
MNNYFKALIFTSAISYNLMAQHQLPISDQNSLLTKASQLINDEQFALAKEELSDYLLINESVAEKKTRKHAEMLMAYCSIKMDEENSVEVAEKFIDENPEDIDKNLLYFELANKAFQKRNYNKALHYIDACDANFLSKEKREKYSLYEGYSFYKAGKIDKALEVFSRLANSSKKYQYEAHWYKALIHFEKENWQNCINEIQTVKNHIPANQWSIYEVKSLYNLGRFNEVVDKKYSNSNQGKAKWEILEIEGLSQFHLKNKQETAKILGELYQKKQSMSAESRYALAFTHYHLGDKKMAEKVAKSVKRDHESLDYQNAQFLLAKIYLENKDKEKAAFALEQVLKNKNELGSQELSHYQLIKLSFEQKISFVDTEEFIYSFMEKYPNSVYKEELFGLLVQNFIKNKEYEKGVGLLESVELRDIRLRKLYQEICLYRGIQYYNLKDYPKAISFFDKSMTQKVNPRYTAKASLWKAEALNQQKDYAKAYQEYKKFDQLYASRSASTERNIYKYHFGYTAFKQQKYSQAVKQWERFVNSPGIDQAQKVDAYLRLGDAYMLMRSFDKAKDNFRMAADMEGDHMDYATYLEAICEDVLGNKENVIQILTNYGLSYPNSIYADDALFYLGDTHFKRGNQGKAYSLFNKFVKKYPNSKLLPNAEISIANINYNNRYYDLALQNNKDIVSKYPNTEFEKQAIENIKNIYYSQGNAQSYLDYIAALGKSDESQESLDNYTYNSAFKLFKEANFTEAAKSFEFYLQKFPKGIHLKESQFYLAHAYLKTNQEDKAASSLEKVVAEENYNEFSEESYLRLANLNYNKKNFAKAKKYYQKLKDKANTDNYLKKSMIGLMRTSKELKQFETVMTMSSSLLSRTDISEAQRTEASYLLGVSAFENGSYKVAQEQLQPFANNVGSPHLSQANYYLLSILSKKGNYKGVLKYFYNNNANFRSDKEIYGKSMMLYAQAYQEQKDFENAKLVYQKVIDINPNEHIVSQAKEALSQLESK